jgi:cytochrome c oxidase subunit II
MLGVLIAAAATAGAQDGRSLYRTCSACHGAGGEGVAALGTPAIAGLDAPYLERQLLAFATGARGSAGGDTYGATMRAAVSVVPDDGARVAVARYVSGLQRRPVTPGKPGNGNGRNFWNSLCSACHAADGSGNEALGAPRLAGMQRDYLARQLAAFRAGTRGGAGSDRLASQMRTVAGMLPDARTADDVIAYLAGLASR